MSVIIDKLSGKALLVSVPPQSNPQLEDNTESAAQGNVGTLRYREETGASYFEACMQSDDSTYEWEVLKQNTWTAQTQVPDSDGLTQAEFEVLLTAAGLTLGAVTTDYSDTVAEDDIISQVPAAGTTVDVGSSVAIVVSLGVASHDLLTMDAGTWLSESNTFITDPGIHPDPSISDGSGGTDASPLDSADWNAIDFNTGLNGVFAYSGGVFDKVNDRLILAGGGHTDYAGNAIYPFDLVDMRWEREDWPSADSTWDFDDSDGILPDGRPMSRHTYSAVAMSESQEKIYLSGKYAGWSGSSPGLFWEYDLSAKTYTQLDSIPANPSGGGIEYSCESLIMDEDRGLLFAKVWTGLWYMDVTDTAAGWTLANNDFWDKDYNLTEANVIYDPVNKLIMSFGSNQEIIYDVTDLGSVTKTKNPTWTGTGSSFTSARAPGLAWDSDNNEVVAWSGGEDIYIIDIANLTITTESPEAGNTVTPTTAHVNGTFKRFGYSETYGVFVGVNDIDEAVYFYKRA